MARTGMLSRIQELHAEAERRIEDARNENAVELDLLNHGLTELPDSLWTLQQLRKLALGSNQLTTIPDALGNLPQLQELYLYDNKLTTIPDALGNLTQLQKLSLAGNQLTTIPDALGNLTQLRALYLYNNQLTTIPDAIGNLRELQELYLHRNQLTTIPNSLRNLTTLERLYLHGNDALGLSPEVLGPAWDEVGVHDAKPAKPKDILDFYYKTRAEPSRRLGEAKILLVGQGGVGKTSLVNRLIDNKFSSREPKTDGIAIRQWSVPNCSPDADPGEKIRLNVWDFGGQEIMHATHQFFLTKRSLYLLLIDARQGEIEGNIHYWLRIIQSYGGDSPVFIVTNKIEAHALDLNQTRFVKDYSPNIRGFFGTSCKSRKGIAKLRAAIEEEINAIPHVNDELPASYFSVKEKLESVAEEKDYIDTCDYEKMCTAEGITTDDEQNRLLRFLHDLGGVLNFDDPKNPLDIRYTKILNPEWVTEGVYKILNDKKLPQDQGVLDVSRLKRILLKKDGYPTERHNFIIGMMKKFELCFDYPGLGGQQLLVPELLPKNEPDLDWNKNEALNFQYHYSVLPGGLISRFIVRMHHNLSDDPVFWRSGVQLEIDGNECLIRADTEKHRMFISVRGQADKRRRALTVIRDAFKLIHRSVPRLEAKEKVPLPDNPNVVVDYEHLLAQEQNNINVFMPEGATKKYDIRELLDGVDEEREFDVFLAHNSSEKPKVRQLASKLSERKLNVWLDEDEILAGERFQKELEKIIVTTRSAAVLVGKDGIGPWQDMEIEALLIEFVRRQLTVIPVLLPGAGEAPELPVFLRGLEWVDLRSGLRKPGLDKLEKGIRGRKSRKKPRTS